MFERLLPFPTPRVTTNLTHTSLSMIVEFLALCHQGLERNPEAFKTIQISIGNEPIATQRLSFRLHQHDLPQEIQRALTRI